MSIVAIDTPGPVLLAAEVKAALGMTDGDDYVTALIAAAQQQIDGPDGWLGRAIGVQTLEYVPDNIAACTPVRFELPYPPFKQIISVNLTQADGSFAELASSAYITSGVGSFGILAVRPSAPWPFGRSWQSMRVRYQAGYDPTKVPAPIRQAIMQMVRGMQAMAARDPSLTVDTVYGVGSQQFAAGAAAASADKLVMQLLSNYRVRSF